MWNKLIFPLAAAALLCSSLAAQSDQPAAPELPDGDGKAIVQAVWNVEYHPLRHDAALFTNIMRIRRLLGEDGSEIIRVTEDGYRFVPPRDFVFVIPR